MLGRLLSRARGDGIFVPYGNNQPSDITIYDWAKMFRPGNTVAFGGARYQAFKMDNATSSPGSDYYDGNTIVFACVATRVLLFSEARFQFQRIRNGRPGDYFGTNDLAPLEEPFPGHTTRDLLAQVELDVAQYGNSYWVRDGKYLQRLNPPDVKVLTAQATESVMTGQTVGQKLLGYAVTDNSTNPPTVTTYTPEEVCHHKPYPDMKNRFVGLSWLSPCLPDIEADIAMSSHKQAVLGNGAQLSYVVTFDPSVSTEQFKFFVDTFRRDHEGADNSGKTLFLGAGADVKTVGQSFENLALGAITAGGETRIAACSGVPPTVLGFSEGLKGSSLNAGNYGQARRRLVDGTMRPLWGFFSSAMASIISVPGGSRLWYDDRDIAFLREDSSDQANILSLSASTLHTLISCGYKPDACVDAVVNSDLARLQGNHTGLTSVQLQPPGAGEPFPPIIPAGDTAADAAIPGTEGGGAPASNGNSNGAGGGGGKAPQVSVP